MERPYFPVAIDSTKPCKIWKGGVSGNGYGYGWFEGKSWRVHRYAFYKATGNLNPKLGVCHSCNNKLCWEPLHLYQGSQSANMKQATQDGLTSKKLSPDNVREIRKLFKKYNDSEISKLFKVSRRAINNIRLGKAWSNLDE